VLFFSRDSQGVDGVGIGIFIFPKREKERIRVVHFLEGIGAQVDLIFCVGRLSIFNSSFLGGMPLNSLLFSFLGSLRSFNSCVSRRSRLLFQFQPAFNLSLALGNEPLVVTRHSFVCWFQMFCVGKGGLAAIAPQFKVTRHIERLS
jgi:hypothetical protein